MCNELVTSALVHQLHHNKPEALLSSSLGKRQTINSHMTWSHLPIQNQIYLDQDIIYKLTQNYNYLELRTFKIENWGHS